MIFMRLIYLIEQLALKLQIVLMNEEYSILILEASNPSKRHFDLHHIFFENYLRYF